MSDFCRPTLVASSEKKNRPFSVHTIYFCRSTFISTHSTRGQIQLFLFSFLSRLYSNNFHQLDLCSSYKLKYNKLCAWRHNMPPSLSPVGTLAPRAPSSRRNVAVLSHAEYVPTLTAAAALCVKAALSKAAW